MSDRESCLVKIPVERWNVNFRVAPNRPLAEAEALLLTLINEIGNLNDLIDVFPENDFPWSLLVNLEENDFVKIYKDQSVVIRDKELSKLTGTFELIDRIRKGGLTYRTTESVVKDRINGKFHHPRVLNLKAEMKSGLVTEVLKPKIEESLLEDEGVCTPKYDTENLVKSVEGRLKFKSKRDDIIERTRIESITDITMDEAEIEFRYRRGNDGLEIPHPVKQFEKSTLIALGQKVFKPRQTESETVSWNRSPELRVLDLCNRIRQDNFNNKELLEYLPTLVKEVIDEINNSEEIRADFIEVETGTEFHQQNLIRKILSNSQKRCVILSSFLNSEFSDDIAKLLNKTIPENVELTLLYGHSEDIGHSDAENNAKNYHTSLNDNGLTKRVTIHPTKRKTHAKIAINDRGHCWIGSYNLLSGAPGSDTTECGVLIHSIALSKKLLQKLIDWNEEQAGLRELGDILGKLENKAYNVREDQYKMVVKSADNIQKADDNYSLKKIKKDLGNILAFFKGVYERPVVRTVDTDEHREVVVELVRDAKERIILASDRVKKDGLDKTLSRLISKKETRLLWGREDPKAYNRKNEDMVKAKELIKNLKTDMKKLLLTSLNPMMSHAKLVQTDDMRILITSDNFLSYGDVSSLSDSRELGVLIDSPRIATLVRGELELTHRELRRPKNRLRWGVALAVEAEKVGSGKRAENAIRGVVNRCVDENGGPNMLHKDFKLTQGRIRNSKEFMIRLIKTAKSLGLLRIPNISTIYKKKQTLNVEQINTLKLFIPDHTNIWKEEK